MAMRKSAGLRATARALVSCDERLRRVLCFSCRRQGCATLPPGASACLVGHKACREACREDCPMTKSAAVLTFSNTVSGQYSFWDDFATMIGDGLRRRGVENI